MGVIGVGSEGDATVRRAHKKVTWSELGKHRSTESCWIAIEGNVYDVTEFAKTHPGGIDNVLLAGGRECTSLFASYHPLWVWNSYKSKLQKQYVGELVSDKNETVFPHNSNITPFYTGLKKRVEKHFKQLGVDPRQSLDMSVRIPAILVAIVALHYATFFLCESFAAALCVTLLHGWVCALSCLTGVHEASHSAVGHTPSVWKTLGVVAHGFLNGANFQVWQNQHIVGHHLLTNVHDADPDIAGDLFRFSPNQKWLAHHSNQYIVAPLAYGLLSLRTRLRDFLIFFDGTATFGPLGFNYSRKSFEIAILLLSKLFFATYRYIVPYYYGVSLFRIIALTIVSDYVGSVYLAFLFQCNHVVLEAEFPKANAAGVVEGDWGKMQLATTQDYGHDSYMTYWVTGALNYQVTHHLFPYVSQSHYRQLAPVIQEYCKEHGVRYIARKNFLQAAAAHLGLLKELASPKSKSQ